MKDGDSRSYIALTLESGVCIAALDRVSQANSFNWEMMKELEQVLARVQSDEEIKGLILTGSGDKFFSAGADMKLVKALDLRGYAEFLGKRHGHHRTD